MIHIHNGILLNCKKECIRLSPNKWMNIETIIQSKVSQKEKDKYHILTHIYMESRKMVLMHLSAG